MSSQNVLWSDGDERAAPFQAPTTNHNRRRVVSRSRCANDDVTEWHCTRCEHCRAPSAALRRSAAAVGGGKSLPPHSAATTARPLKVKCGSGFIRSQMHTCRLGGSGRGSTLSCAACSGMASVQHARFIDRTRLYEQNLRHATRAGLVNVIEAPTHKRPSRRHVVALE
jgi:hypothetical protein